MLVLTRKIGESLFIGQEAEIKIKVLTNDGYRVRLGIEAPRAVFISRAELRSKKPLFKKKEALEGCL